MKRLIKNEREKINSNRFLMKSDVEMIKLPFTKGRGELRNKVL